MTGSIASAAYFVARSQREIATNKYNLDLFDKRWEIYKEFYPFYTDKNNIFDSSFKEKETVFEKIPLIFNGITQTDIKSLHDNKSRIESLDIDQKKDSI
ncbi:hypothetical protein NO263_03365 [Gluconacetobacter entanii]|uniref:Uncharacterized protein n=1 Tax=Gluconacetobacter entanii TaxID=108528 RepID=A0ABT3K2I9_9PROT|nr:hypothetical protein [Gluconacetobacter entanii]MCW4589614.1 hypothetical protein [Gluconacetobacter entanii]NPC89180.1 hypothetical protein [Gluconacetobacter entanii]